VLLKALEEAATIGLEEAVAIGRAVDDELEAIAALVWMEVTLLAPGKVKG
jgi:hypothetical protein